MVTALTDGVYFKVDTGTREESAVIRDSDERNGEEADISDCSAAAASSFIAKFKQPAPSHLARKRKIPY